jgi:hypothetical protein
LAGGDLGSRDARLSNGGFILIEDSAREFRLPRLGVNRVDGHDGRKDNQQQDR